MSLKPGVSSPETHPTMGGMMRLALKTIVIWALTAIFIYIFMASKLNQHDLSVISEILGWVAVANILGALLVYGGIYLSTGRK